MARFLRQPARRPCDGRKERRGSGLEEARRIEHRPRRVDRRLRRRLGRGRDGGRREDQIRARRRSFRRGIAAGDARFGARHHDDPRLSHARPPARQFGSARAADSQGSRVVACRQLRVCGSRLHAPDLHRRGARLTIRHRAGDVGDLKAHLLRHDRLRIHAHLRSGGKVLVPGADRRPGKGDQLYPRGQTRDPQQTHRGRRLRKIHRSQVHRDQALRSRRRRSRWSRRSNRSSSVAGRSA